MKDQKQYDKKIVRVMVQIYCSHHHKGKELCVECADLLDYINRRINSCPLGDKKTTCKSCPIHCYSPNRRVQIQEVMKFSGKRIIFKHPIAAIRHLLHL
ncbi:MAG: nitrous oxide-stimulated promoter family protein [Phocaeicola sp.]